MKYEIHTANSATAHLDAGDELSYLGSFLRDDKVASPFPVPHWREAWFPRLLSGRLFFCSRTAENDERLCLSGEHPHSQFHSIDVPDGRAYWVKMKFLAAFSFGHGAKFSSATRWLDPVAWLIGASRSVYVHGPAHLLFYGSGLMVSDKNKLHSDLIVAFDASEPFRVSGYDPGKNLGAQLINALSSTVVMTFDSAPPLLETTIRPTKRNRFIALSRLLLGVVLGSLASWIIFGS